MWHIRPFALSSGSIEPISSNILRSARWDVLCQLQQETGHREGFDLTLEEFVVRNVGDHRGIAILTNAYLLHKDSGGREMYWERALRAFVE